MTKLHTLPSSLRGGIVYFLYGYVTYVWKHCVYEVAEHTKMIMIMRCVCV